MISAKLYNPKISRKKNTEMPIEVARMTEADIDGAIDTIQQAFADDPYNNWVYPDRSKVLNQRTHPTYYRVERA